MKVSDDVSMTNTHHSFPGILRCEPVREAMGILKIGSNLNFVMVINGLVLANKMCLTAISTNKMRVVKSGGGVNLTDAYIVLE